MEAPVGFSTATSVCASPDDQWWKTRTLNRGGNWNQRSDWYRNLVKRLNGSDWSWEFRPETLVSIAVIVKMSNRSTASRFPADLWWWWNHESHGPISRWATIIPLIVLFSLTSSSVMSLLRSRVGLRHFYENLVCHYDICEFVLGVLRSSWKLYNVCDLQPLEIQHILRTGSTRLINNEILTLVR